MGTVTRLTHFNWERRQSGKAKNEIGKLDTKGVNDERILLLGTSWKQE